MKAKETKTRKPWHVHEGDMGANRWFVDCRPERGKVYGNISKGKTIEERRRLANELLAKLLSERELTPDTRQSRPLIELIDRAQPRVCLLLRDSSKQVYGFIIRRFRTWCIDNKIQTVTPDVAITFMLELRQKLQLKAGTFNLNRMVLIRVFHSIDPDAKNPFQGIPKMKGKATPYMSYDKEYANRIINEAKKNLPQLYLAMSFVYYGFIRPGELRQLQVAHILFEQEKILVRTGEAKNKEFKQVKIPNQLMEIIHEFKLDTLPPEYYIVGKKWRPGPIPVGRDTLSRRHQQLLERIGINSKIYKLYSWRHTGASRIAANKAIPIKELQIHMRHANLNQTDQYLQSRGFDEWTQIKTNFPDM